MQKVLFRYGQSEMVAYLLIRGHNYKNIEVSTDKQNKKKVFFIFEGNKEEFIKLKNEFDDKTEISLKEYIDKLYEVKILINKYINNQ